MNHNPLIFISRNKFKYQELAPLFKNNAIEIKHVSKEIFEIQSSNLKAIIQHKTLRAFQEFGRPVLVEHTGLFIKAWGGMPGGQTQLFWDRLQGEKMCNMLRCFSDKSAIAKTIIGFCDGKRLYSHFEGRLEGVIAEEPHKGRQFQWGNIFIPKMHTQAYSELNISEINSISHRAAACNQFFRFWKEYSKMNEGIT